MIYYSADSMRHLYQRVDYTPKRWLKNDLNDIEKKILGHRENIRLWLHQKGWVFSLRPTLERQLPGLLSCDPSLETPPTLKVPDFFNRPLATDLKSFLLATLSHHAEFSRMKTIVDRAQLDLLSPEFYALPSMDGFVIHGNPAATYGHLLCFAHELGHALYELDFPGDEVGSEVAAFKFEDQVAAMVLMEPEYLAQWQEYKSAQDQLNYLLCLNEFAEYDTGRSRTPKNYLFFRESLVTCWGYQTVNAWASLQRSVFAITSPECIE